MPHIEEVTKVENSIFYVRQNQNNTFISITLLCTIYRNFLGLGSTREFFTHLEISPIPVESTNVDLFYTRHSWNPNMPSEVAVETSLGPNHTAAILAGRPRVKIYAIAQTVWANIRTGNRSGETHATFSQAPRALRKASATAQNSRECRQSYKP